MLIILMIMRDLLINKSFGPERFRRHLENKKCKPCLKAR